VRLITKSSKRQSRGAPPVRRTASKKGGLVVTSAEGLRFAYASTPVPKRDKEETSQSK
jgi:hypothetical protein